MNATVTHKCEYCNQQTGELKSCVCRSVRYCNSACQKADWKLHRPNCPPFVLKDSPNKGKGLFATRNLKIGSLILFEDPLLVFESSIGVSQLAITVAFIELSKADKEKVLSLYCPDNTDQEDEVITAAKIFDINCIDVSPEDVQESALYYNISRLNHSCAPNAAWSWKKGNIRQKEVRACLAISSGKEILVSYLDRYNKFDQRDKRQAELNLKWKFHCECQVCILTGANLLANENIRKEIQVYDDDIPRYSRVGNIEKALSCALKEVESMRTIKEEITISLVAALLECYELLCAAKALGIKINPKRVGVKLERPDVYRKEAYEIIQNCGLDFMMKNYDSKIAKIARRYVIL